MQPGPEQREKTETRVETESERERERESNPYTIALAKERKRVRAKASVQRGRASQSLLDRVREGCRASKRKKLISKLKQDPSQALPSGAAPGREICYPGQQTGVFQSEPWDEHR